MTSTEDPSSLEFDAWKAIGTSALHVTSDEGLLTAFAALTHRMDSASRNRGDNAPRTLALRAQRDLVQAEILRRMSDA